MGKKGVPCYAARKPRPHVWRSGPDPVEHDIYNTWATSRAQAHFRNEGWELTFAEYLKIWKPYWSQRGRAGDDLCLARIIYSKPWAVGNVELITRAENVRRHAQFRLEKNNIARANGTYIPIVRGSYKKR